MRDTRALLEQFSLKPTKSLGQNFLRDANMVAQIADSADLSEQDLVIEIGPGVGSLTGELLSRAGRVVAVEIDKKLIQPLEALFGQNPRFSLISADILKTDVRKLILHEMACQEGLERVKIVANLPYYITTPIIMKLLEEAPGVASMVFMVQKEVADRMAAKPGKKDYGALTVAVQYRASVGTVLTVPPHCFIPQPGVDSSVVKMDIYEKPPYKAADDEMFSRVVRAAFGQRRKTLQNALTNGGIGSKNETAELIESCGFGAQIRGEVLSVAEFVKLSDAVSAIRSR